MPLILQRDTTVIEQHGAPEHNVAIFRTLHQVDTISRKGAADFRQINSTRWLAKDHPREAFFLNLMDNPDGHLPLCAAEHGTIGRGFLWRKHLNSTEWGRRIVLNVQSFYLVFLERQSRPGLWIRLDHGSEGTLDVLAES